MGGIASSWSGLSGRDSSPQKSQEATEGHIGVAISPELGANCAPIALFVYNRPEHTRQTVEALQKNELAKDSDLIIFSDAAKSPAQEATVQAVRTYIKSVDGFKSVTISEKDVNWGVDPSVIDGVTMLCEKYGQVIVLEDDLITSRWFLKYMNHALNHYRDDEQVMQVGGFMFPINGFDATHACFLPFTSSWGWATWKRAWNCFDPTGAGFTILEKDKQARRAFDLNGAYDYFDALKQYIEGKVDAWDIRWYLSVYLKGGMALYPQKSLVMNIGFDGSGVHCAPSDFPGNEISDADVLYFPKVEAQIPVLRAVENYLRSKRESSLRIFARRILKKVGRGL
jgi:hypothetical protein